MSHQVSDSNVCKCCGHAKPNPEPKPLDTTVIIAKINDPFEFRPLFYVIKDLVSVCRLNFSRSEMKINQVNCERTIILSASTQHLTFDSFECDSDEYEINVDSKSLWRVFEKISKISTVVFRISNGLFWIDVCMNKTKTSYKLPLIDSDDPKPKLHVQYTACIPVRSSDFVDLISSCGHSHTSGIIQITPESDAISFEWDDNEGVYIKKTYPVEATTMKAGRAGNNTPILVRTDYMKLFKNIMCSGDIMDISIQMTNDGGIMNITMKSPHGELSVDTVTVTK